MIDRREILDMATRMSLNPHVVEKDYVLGWMLAGISAHPVLSTSWLFKGGTCLKKCFFETYRFSEDLDFTLTDPSQIDQAFLTETFRDIGEWIYDRTGIEIPDHLQKFDIYTNPRGTTSCQGKISYRGPVATRDLPRIKLDLTADERIVLAPVRVPVFHPYSDAPEEGIDVLSYAYEELFGEKVRALAERKAGEATAPLIDFLTLGELMEIVLRTDNWDGVFEPIFRNRDWFKRDIEVIGVARNPNAHYRANDSLRLIEAMIVWQRLSSCIDDDGQWRDDAECDE